MMQKLLFLILIILLASCVSRDYEQKNPEQTKAAKVFQHHSFMIANFNDNTYKYQQLFKQNPLYISDGFDFPVGKPGAKGYYNAQKFGQNNHLGEDWNAVTGGNSDLGHPIYTIANGYISFAEDIGGGWGKVVRIIHQLNEKKLLESVYAHCNEIQVKKGQFVKRGEKIATIGNAGGIYFAHLHLELRDSIDMDIGPGYDTQTTGYLHPTKFIEANRPY